MKSHPFENDLSRAEGCLFLCSGNMIRSAFAELYATHLRWSLPLRSAGTVYPNSAIHPKARAALLQRGVDHDLIQSFRPQLIEDLAPAPGSNELVFGMTRDHLQQADEQGASGPGYLLTQALGDQDEIADPYFEGGFEGVFEHIARCVEALVQMPDR